MPEIVIGVQQAAGATEPHFDGYSLVAAVHARSRDSQMLGLERQKTAVLAFCLNNCESRKNKLTTSLTGSLFNPGRTPV